MKWLYWKEWRQNRVVIISLAVLLIVPYVFGLIGIAIEMRRPHPNASFAREILMGAAMYSLAISQLALALIGGNAIAGERSDRSAEFQAYLPISRRKILGSKLLMVLTVFAIIWVINPIVIWCLRRPDSPMAMERDVLWMAFCAAIVGLLFFGVAWLFSSFLTSPTFSVAAGIMAPLILAGLLAYISFSFIEKQLGGPMSEAVFVIGYHGLSVVVALVSFGIGCWLYLRRVEP
jgi:ABC-type transport system involved in multi-copper enzyme maturation permease subunit